MSAEALVIDLRARTFGLRDDAQVIATSCLKG